MYFVINCFISAVCIISLILFTEVFPKWTKLLVGAVQVVTTSYAIAILIKKIGEWTSVWSGDYKYINSNFLWILPIVAVITIAVAYICNKKSKKQQNKNMNSNSCFYFIPFSLAIASNVAAIRVNASITC